MLNEFPYLASYENLLLYYDKIPDKMICPILACFVFLSRFLYFSTIAVVPSLSALYCLNNRTELRYFVISFVPFAPAECVMCQFIFKLLFSQTLNILFEISLLFRITVTQTAIISCVMIVMITFWTKYLTQFFSCHIKVIRPYFLQTNSCALSEILLLFISQC